MIFTSITNYIELARQSFDTIPVGRKETLSKIADFISGKLKEGAKAELVYICTHNSRRSHFGQIWARVAATYYGFSHVHTYSGGTEATAFNPNAIRAIKKIGFGISSDYAPANPHYRVSFDEEGTEIVCFSKVYDGEHNPESGFCAIMTCSEAEANCPFVSGAAARISTTYEDPKAFDNTPQQEAMYDERCRQIATETLYAFSLVK